MNGQLEQIRLRINETDKELSCLFSQRMDLVAQVAKIKEKAGLPVYDPKREKQVLDCSKCDHGKSDLSAASLPMSDGCK